MNYCYLPNLEASYNTMSSHCGFFRLIKYLSFVPNIKLKIHLWIGRDRWGFCFIISPEAHSHLAFVPCPYDVTFHLNTTCHRFSLHVLSITKFKLDVGFIWAFFTSHLVLKNYTHYSTPWKALVLLYPIVSINQSQFDDVVKYPCCPISSLPFHIKCFISFIVIIKVKAEAVISWHFVPSISQAPKRPDPTIPIMKLIASLDSHCLVNVHIFQTPHLKFVEYFLQTQSSNSR